MRGCTTLFLVILSISLLAQDSSLSRYSTADGFMSGIIALQNGEISSLSLDFLDSIKLKRLMDEKIDERDSKRHKSGYISAKQLKPIDQSSICEVNDACVLVVVEDQFRQLRALTIEPSGKPIECFLIYDDFLYISRDFYEQEGRRYSPSRPWFFNAANDEFIFSTIFKIREPVYDEVLIDLNAHLDETNNKIRLKLNDRGEFTSYHFEHLVPNRVEFPAFTLESSFFQPNAGKLIENQSTSRDDDRFRVYLGISETIDLRNNAQFVPDEIIRVIPNTRGAIKVYQQYTTALGINGDGDFCDIESPLYTSDWEEVAMQNDLFCVKKYSIAEQQRFAELSVEGLKKKVRTNCGEHHFSSVEQVSNQAEIAAFVSMSKVILKIEFTDAKTKVVTEELLLFELASGC